MLYASAKNRCGLRVERLCPPACHTLYPDTAPESRCRARLSAPAVINSLHTSIPTLPPTPTAAPPASGTFPLQCAPKPPLAIPSRRGRSAALFPPFHTDAILSATFLPPTEEEAACITSPQHFSIIRASAFAPSLRCRLPPSPDARCADALTPLRQSANHFTHSESAYGLGQGQVGTLS